MTGAAADEWGSKGVPNQHPFEQAVCASAAVTAVSQLLNAVDRRPRRQGKAASVGGLFSKNHCVAYRADRADT